MNPTPKTIQIFLPGGDPRGIRIAEITTRIVQVIEVPRSLLQDFVKMPESNQVALYFLFGEAEDPTETKVYIGQTGDLRARLTSHNRDKGSSIRLPKLGCDCPDGTKRQRLARVEEQGRQDPRYLETQNARWRVMRIYTKPTWTLDLL